MPPVALDEPDAVVLPDDVPLPVVEEPDDPDPDGLPEPVLLVLTR